MLGCRPLARCAERARPARRAGRRPPPMPRPAAAATGVSRWPVAAMRAACTQRAAARLAGRWTAGGWPGAKRARGGRSTAEGPCPSPPAVRRRARWRGAAGRPLLTYGCRPLRGRWCRADACRGRGASPAGLGRIAAGGRRDPRPRAGAPSTCGALRRPRPRAGGVAQDRRRGEPPSATAASLGDALAT